MNGLENFENKSTSNLIQVRAKQSNLKKKKDEAKNTANNYK